MICAYADAHHRERDQVVRGRVHRRAHVEDQRERVLLLAVALAGGVHGGQRGAPHAREQA